MVRKTWTQKFAGAKPPHISLLEKPFAGMPVGTRLLISSPEAIAAYIRAIPSGETRSVIEMRQAFAEEAGVDATCPTSTGIFLRIAAEAALEAPGPSLLPFWRVIDPTSPLAVKLSCGPDFLRDRRAEEAR
jgi:hypothetical protein